MLRNFLSGQPELTALLGDHDLATLCEQTDLDALCPAPARPLLEAGAAELSAVAQAA